MTKQEQIISLDVSAEVFNETPNQKIECAYLVIKFTNPNTHGFPEVANWEEKYSVNMEVVRKKIQEIGEQI